MNIYQKAGKGMLITLLTLSVMLGAYLGFLRYLSETQSRTVELVADLNELRKVAAYEKVPLNYVLDEARKKGITGLGVFEETLPDASARGEIYFAKGAGILSIKPPVFNKVRINPLRTYIYAPDDRVRKRIAAQLRCVTGEKALRFWGREIIEVDEIEEELRSLGLGIAEVQRDYLLKKGFTVIPRMWNDTRYNLGNIDQKIAGLSDYDLVIFDGEEVFGYPASLHPLSGALKKYGISYGFIEVIKQSGDKQLKKLMGNRVVRVHSIPADELKKITKNVALDRFARAVQERGVRLLYIRPFLPPQIDAYPVEYNIKYFGEIKKRIEEAGGIIGRTERKTGTCSPPGWQILILSAGVIVGGIFLLDVFFSIPIWGMYIIFAAMMLPAVFLERSGQLLVLQKSMAFSAAQIFPAYAVITTLSRTRKQNAAITVINVLAETFIGIFLMLGLLADYRFMSGVETFPGVKTALILPLLIVAAYFLFKSGEGSWKERFLRVLNSQIRVGMALAGLFIIGALAVLVARSGNFILPVPGAEKYLRSLLETLLLVRPRTKELLVGYPFLFAAAMYCLKKETRWLWCLAAIGAIAPVSVFNSFSHIHTPIIISLVRTLNGAVLGVIIGMLLWWGFKGWLVPGENK
jgi:hypothetical protein